MISKYIYYKPLTALEIDEINHNTPELTVEELKTHEEMMKGL